MTTTTTNQEDYYILDIRNSDDSSRMDAEYVVETGIILATFSQKRHSQLRRVHCALDQLIVQQCMAYRNCKDPKQFLSDLVQPFGGLWHWNGQAFVPVVGTVLHNRLKKRFQDTMRRPIKKSTEEPPQPQRFVIRNEMGIISSRTTESPLAAGHELLSDGCKGKQEFDISSDVSSITTVDIPDWRNPQSVMRQAEMNCLRVVCSNLRERIQLLEWQLRGSPTLLGEPLAESMVLAPQMEINPVMPLPLGKSTMEEEEEEDCEGLTLEKTTSSNLEKVEPVAESMVLAPMEVNPLLPLSLGTAIMEEEDGGEEEEVEDGEGLTLEKTTSSNLEKVHSSE